MSDLDNIATAAWILADAWKNGLTVDALSEKLFPKSVGAAACIQDEMSRLIGEEVVGWKVGGKPGPLVGRIFASRLYTTPAMLPLNRFPQPGIECEIGFRLLRDLPPRSQSYSREDVVNAAALAFTIELTGTRFKNGKLIADTDHELRAIVADNAVGAGLVVGPEVADWRRLSLLDIPVSLRINGEGPMAPNPKDKRTEPIEILEWLANELSQRKTGLRAGQYVTTGSATLPMPLQPGDVAVSEFGEFGKIQVALAKNTSS